MTTSQLLEGITDAGKFELLASDILRYKYPELEGLIHIGVTTSGRTRRSPLDGFLKIPYSEPPHYALIQHTTVDLVSLKEKWIDDLEKAHKISLTIQEENAVFTIYLTSNKIINDEICKKIYQRASELALAPILIENTIISAFLDNDENGQWLRKKYFGVIDEKLSKNRFTKLCQESLERYEHNLFECKVESLIDREIETTLIRKIKTNKKSIFFIVGESGYGKSSIAYKTLVNLKNSDFTLWFPPEIINNNYSLQDSLSDWFKQLYPYIESKSGEQAVRNVNVTEKNLVIVIDDINRTNNPVNILDKIIRWLKSKEEKSFSSNIKFIIPLWPQIFRQIKTKIERLHFIDSLFLDRYSLDEAKTVLLNGLKHMEHSHTIVEIESFVKNLGLDPFLIGLFLENLDFNRGLITVEPHDIIYSFINRCIQELGSQFMDYYQILFELSSKMILENNHYPSWNYITKWFDNQNKLVALKDLVNQGKICRTDELFHLHFRHDRLKDYFMVENFKHYIKSNDDEFDELFFDPFYAPLVAKAILFRYLSNGFLKKIQHSSPLILFECLKIIKPPDTTLANQIVKNINDWIKVSNIKNNLDDPPNWEVYHSFAWLLAETDSPFVLDITDDLPHYSNIALARLRNGSIDSGIRYCSRDGAEILRVNDPQRDKILKHALMRYKDKIIEDLRNILENPSDFKTEYIRGALFIIGQLRLYELEHDLSNFWDLVQNKAELLSLMLWATMRCCKSSINVIMEELIDFWLTLPDEGENSIKQVSSEIEFGLKKKINPIALNILIEKANAHEKLKWPVSYLLRGVDNRSALEFVIKEASEIKKSLEGTDKFSVWLNRIDDEWNPRLHRSRKMSKDSVDFLRSLWEDDLNDKYIRTISFQLWLHSLNQDDLDFLKEVQNEKLFFNLALYKRVGLGDLSCIYEYCNKLRTKPYWVHMAYKIWSNPIIKEIIHIINSDEFVSDSPNYKKDSFFWDLAEVLTKIPTYKADIFIVENWDDLKSNYKIIQAALYVGTEKCLKLAKQAIINLKDRDSIFKYISSLFGCNTLGKREYLTLEKMKNLIPYLNHIPPNELGYFGQHCQKIGEVEWSKMYLYERMDPLYKKTLHPTNDQLYSEIESILKLDDIFGRTYFWVERFDERKDTKERLLGLLSQLLDKSPSYKSAEFVSICLKLKGERRDLNILDHEFPEEISYKIKRLKEATRFRIYRRTLM
ncbi:MAG: hypothetical protein ACFFB5_12750 [Promethearchaeota archaeon]